MKNILLISISKFDHLDQYAFFLRKKIEFNYGTDF